MHMNTPTCKMIALFLLFNNEQFASFKNNLACFKNFYKNGIRFLAHKKT